MLRHGRSRRRVPLQPELVRLGFLRFAEEQRKLKTAFLLDELAPDKYGKRSAAWSKWWGRYCRKFLGIKGKHQVFHSMRHGFKEICRESGISEEHHNAITGHANGSVERSYGGTFYPLKPLAAAIKRLRYPGLSLSNVKPRAGSLDTRTGHH